MGARDDRIGRYLVRHELARGGQGAVYRAHDPELGRDVALKLLSAAGGLHPEDLERFRREAEAIARVRHPGIVALHATGMHRGRPYLVLELVDGDSLERRLRSHGLPEPRQAATWVARIARALAAAHAQGVLHRDLKPQNVLLTRDGRPLLTDFGLAKRLDPAQQRLTVTGQLLGTPPYMSPEQAFGDPSAIDARADVYGLGALLYALLTGSPPFPGEGLLPVLRRVLEDPVTPPSRLRPGLPPWLEGICLRCLEKDPNRRFPSAEAVAAALEAGPGEDHAPPAGSRRLALGLALGGALSVLGLLGVALGFRPRGPAPTPTPAGSPNEPAAAASPAEPPPEVVLPGSAASLVRRVASKDAIERAWVAHDAAARAEARQRLQAAEGFGSATRQLGGVATSALRERARARLALGEPELALESADAAIALTPTDLRLHAARGVALVRLGRAAEAAGALERVVHEDRRGDHPYAWAYLGVLREVAGFPDTAEEAYGQAIAREPEQPEWWARRGFLRVEQGALLEGRCDLSVYLRGERRGDPGQQVARELLERLGAAGGEPLAFVPLEFIADPLTPVRLDPAPIAGSPCARLTAATALESASPAACAASAASCSAVLAGDPLALRAWILRGIARYDLGDLWGGLADLDQAVQLATALELSAHERGGALYYRALLRCVAAAQTPELLEGAAHDLDWLCEHDPERAPWGLGLRGVIDIARALSDLAYQHLQKLEAIDQAEPVPDALRYACYGFQRLMRGNDNGARRAFRASLQADPRHDLAHFVQRTLNAIGPGPR